MPLPRLLIIGAMKAGTTGLYMDLAGHAQVHLSSDKEPHNLCSDEVLSAAGRAAYAAIYAKASPDQLCCDASTGYTKRPDYEGVADRAVKVLPPDFKLIYIVRHPIDRIISQHHHEHFEGKVGATIDDEVRRHPRYVQYSRYSYQLQPWAAAVGWDRIKVIRFEDYVDCRTKIVSDVWKFLDLPTEPCAVDEGAVYNKSQGKPVKTRFWHTVQHNAAYRRFVRPFAPLKLRLALRRAIFPKAAAELAPPSAETVAFLRDALADDVHRLAEQLNRPLFWSDFAGSNQSSSPSLAEQGIVG